MYVHYIAHIFDDELEQTLNLLSSIKFVSFVRRHV